MILIEKKVIEEIPKIYKLINVNIEESQENHRQARKLLNKLVATMIDSKEVEAVDIFKDVHDSVIAPSVKHLLTNLGYQLIKIKQ